MVNVKLIVQSIIEAYDLYYDAPIDHGSSKQCGAARKVGLTICQVRKALHVVDFMC